MIQFSRWELTQVMRTRREWSDLFDSQDRKRHFVFFYNVVELFFRGKVL